MCVGRQDTVVYNYNFQHTTLYHEVLDILFCVFLIDYPCSVNTDGPND